MIIKYENFEKNSEEIFKEKFKNIFFPIINFSGKNFRKNFQKISKLIFSVIFSSYKFFHTLFIIN